MSHQRRGELIKNMHENLAKQTTEALLQNRTKSTKERAASREKPQLARSVDSSLLSEDLELLDQVQKGEDVELFAVSGFKYKTKYLVAKLD